ncbi:MAG: hypothetical protein DRQ39_08515 [Gammaproteobacteria bacterium]|nr:MAG: hypothetical protein DRQ39_08515 [Gammaproteobacteria bacterium]
MSTEYEQLYAEQMRLEVEAKDIKARKEYNDLTKAISQGRFDETMYGNALMKAYFLPIRDKIAEYLAIVDTTKTVKIQNYLKYLCDDANVLAYITIQALLKKLAQRANKTKVTTVAGHIAHSLKVHQAFSKAEEVSPKLIAYLGREYRRASTQRKQNLIDKHLSQYKEDTVSNKLLDVKVGAILIDLVLHSGVGLITKRLSFVRGIDTHSTLYLSFTEEVMDILSSSYYIPDIQALYPPMVIPPKDWTSFKEGGYLSVDFNFMKTPNKAHRKKITNEDFSKPMGVINKLQQVEWRVNTKILDVINYIYKHNLIDPRSPPTLPRLYGDLPTSTVTKLEELIGTVEYNENPTPTQKKEWGKWNKKREQIKIGLDAEQGRRLQYLMALGVAKKMVEYDKFYYVYQLDYRGRVYPVTDFFNPQSKGYVKSMLEFAKGKILTEVGVYWLKVHIANCYGLDKAPLDERVQWVEDNKLRLLRASIDPLSTISIWAEADSPFEFLAGCLAYQQHIEGQPVHLPIGLDAVNSGIQMYSGLLRDATGARSTCVIGDVRSDLYQEVADVVNKKLREGKYPAYITFVDKENKERVVYTQVEARSLIDKVTRSHTKRNIMTIPYSVSMRGMKMQNWDVMDEATLKRQEFWEGDSWVVNTLLTTLIAESAYEIVKGARAGQEYLKSIVRLLSTPTMWHTPIYDIPVYQSFFKSEVTRVNTVLGKLSLVEPTDEVKRQKQLASVAANYIHSIDATILLYVVEHSSSDIGVIHDCFLVHPNQGEEVRDKYKEGYVAVMRTDPLKKFSAELDKEGKVEIPYVGDLDLEEVYDSEYIIS